MSIHPLAGYVTDASYYSVNASTTASQTAADRAGERAEETDSPSEDRVTFSDDLSLAQTRAAIGLNPTGKLKLTDLENVAVDRKAFISSTLEQTMQRLGIGLDEEINLFMDSTDSIRISGDFPEKDALEDALNENEEFTTAFKQLSANQSILDHISQLQNRVQNVNASLVDYFRPDTDFNDLLALVDKYESLRGSTNRMKAFLDLSSAQHPYAYTHTRAETAE